MISGPDLPKELNKHTIESLGGSKIIVIAGEYNSEAISSTFIYDFNTAQWNPGPEMVNARKNHESAVIIDTVTYEKFIVVAGGYGNGYLTSVELLSWDYLENWQKGKKSFHFMSDLF